MKSKRTPFANGAVKTKKNNLFLNKIGLAIRISVSVYSATMKYFVRMSSKISSLKLQNYVISLFQLVIL